MRNLLQMIYEHQLLKGKERYLAIELDAADRVRMMGLHRLLQGEQRDTRLREFARAKVPMTVQFTRPGGFEVGEIRDMSGGGFCIATPRPPEVGTRVIVRIAESTQRCEYVFPCVLTWRAKSGPGRMGVALDGVPRRAAMVGDEGTVVWRRTLRFGAMLSKPMLA